MSLNVERECFPEHLSEKLTLISLFHRLCLQIVLENSSREDKHECPFGRSSIELTKMLCEILKVGELRKCTPLYNSLYSSSYFFVSLNLQSEHIDGGKKKQICFQMVMCKNINIKKHKFTSAHSPSGLR